MARKTFNVEEFKNWVNNLLEQPDSQYRTPEFRRGLTVALEHVLHETGNYHGFNYLDWLEHGFDDWLEAGKPKDTTPFLGDQTKVVFY